MRPDVQRVLLVVLLALAAGLTRPASTLAWDAAVAQPMDADVELFARHDCSACARARAFLSELQRQRPDLRVVEWDVVADAEALARLRRLAAETDIRTIAVPAILVRGTLIVGWVDRATTGRQIEALLDGTATASERGEGEACGVDLSEPSCVLDDARERVALPLVGQVDARDLGLPLFTIVLGLLDGFNPCAMWVLLFLLSLLVNLRSRVRMLAVAGTFVAVSGLIYFAFMAAWLNVFLLVGATRLMQVILGTVALVVGAVNLKDFVAFGRGLSFSIPTSTKPTIYARVNRILHTRSLAMAIVGVAALAVLVNAVELLCTAGLPAVYTQILTTHTLPTWQYYAYLALYQVFYMLDDSLMLVVAVVTLTRRRLDERAGRWLKLASGSVMAGLGLLLLVRPEWLHW